MKFLGQDLFNTTRELEKTAARLPRSVKSWESAILDQLHKQAPYLLRGKIVVSMRNTDEDAGHGVGAIRVGDKVQIPIIVESNNLHPFDIFIDDKGALHALTRASIENVLQSRDIGKAHKGGGTRADTNISHQTYPPYTGKYSFASAIEFDTPDDIVLKGIEDIEITPLMADVLLEMRAPVEKTAAPVREAAIYKETPELPQITKPGIYKVATDKGAVCALVSDQVYPLGSAHPRDNVWGFVSLDKVAGVGSATDIYGVPYSGDIPMGQSSDRGVYVLEREGRVSMTDPITIDPNGGGGTTDGGTTMYITKTSSLGEDIVPIGDTVYLSEDWRFIPCGDGTLKRTKPALAKTASKYTNKFTPLSGRILVEDAADIGLSKSAELEGALPDEFESALESAFGPALTKRAMKELSEGGCILLNAAPVPKLESAPKLTATDRISLWKTAAAITPAFIKEAGITESRAKNTVDAVLGLNYLTDSKIAAFVEKVDVLKDAQQVLAMLLVSSRLGLGLDTSPIRASLLSLDHVIHSLEELRAARDAR